MPTDYTDLTGGQERLRVERGGGTCEMVIGEVPPLHIVESNCLAVGAARRLGMAPGALIAQDRVEGDEEFPGDGDEGELGRFARGAQPLIEVPEDAVAAGRDQRGHVEHLAHRRPAAPAVTLPPAGAAVAGMGRDPDQRGHLVAIEVAEFGEEAEQRAGQRGADARHALEQLVLDPPQGAGLDAVLQLGVLVDQLAFEPADVGLEAAAHPASRRDPAPLALGLEHLLQLPPSREQGGELLRRPVGERMGRGLDAGREGGEDLGIDRVGLGQAAQRLGEGAHLARIDDRHRQPGGREGGGDGRFVAARGFEHDQRDGLLGTGGDERGEARGIGAERAAETGGLTGQHHFGFGDIQPEVDRGRRG